MQPRSDFKNFLIDLALSIHRWISNLLYYLIKIIYSFVKIIKEQI